MKIKRKKGRDIRITAAHGARLQITAAKGGEGEEASLPTFKMDAYTGGAMRLWGWAFPVVIDLSGIKVRGKSRPILRDHDSRQIIGHSDSIGVEKSSLRVEGTISGVAFAAREIVDSAKNGFPWQASVGCHVHEEEFFDRGETVTVNGRKFRGPLHVARKSELMEISFVALGADDNTSAKIAALAAHSQEHTMTFEQWLEAKGLSADDLSSEELATLRAEYKAEIEAGNVDPPEGGEGEGDDDNAGDHDDDGADDDKPARGSRANPKAKPKGTTKPKKPATRASGDTEPGDTLAEERRIRAAEVRRLEGIRKACNGKHSEIEAQAIEDGWTVDKTELAVLKAERPKAPNINTGRGAPAPMQVVAAAMCIRAGLPEKRVGEWYGPRIAEAALKPQHRRMGLHSLIYMVVEAAGGYIRPGVIDDDAIRAAFHADRQLRASSGFSTVGGLTGILGDVAGKALLAAYEAVASVISLIAAETDHTDFKGRTTYRLSGSGALEKVAPDGEIKHATLEEEGYRNQLDTWGKMIALTRQMIINDDLGAFLAIPRLLGRMAALGREKAGFETLLGNAVGTDGNAFFSPAHNNLNYGAESDLDIASLTFVEQMFLNQIDKAGDPILASPAILLVPTSLKTTAQQLMATTTLIGGDVTVLNNNPFSGRFRVVASPYLNAQSLAGSSSKAWYLMADPNDIPTLEIAYLRGQRTPVIESGETDFNTLGTQWRCYWDFSAALADHRGAVKSNGEALSGDDTLTGGEGTDTVEA
jgi:hypothetical protein